MSKFVEFNKVRVTVNGRPMEPLDDIEVEELKVRDSRSWIARLRSEIRDWWFTLRLFLAPSFTSEDFDRETRWTSRVTMKLLDGKFYLVKDERIPPPPPI